ncbi:DoxX family protein [Tellurirhabdus bombi]|uniref:DoxX family protein n=1 Tax=Tellurirhabdus bombi TaxID=2907205 RepID=UPI001F336C33|nr:DoxX family protein [Tellurirhabdus bombi]
MNYRNYYGENKGAATLLLRLGLGIDLGMHGLVRLPKLSKFADKMVADFSATILPDLVVRLFGLTLPFVELTIGILLFMGGRFLNWGAILGGITMSALIFGSALREEWAAVNIQLLHLLAFYFLLRDTERP